MDRKLPMLAFFLFLLPLACADTGFSATCGIQSFEPGGGVNAIAFISTTFAVVSLLIGLAYMYSKAREDPQMGVWAKDEAYNLLITILLFAGALAFFTGSCALSEAYSGADPFTYSTGYIDALTNNRGFSILSSLTHKSIEDQKKATAYLYFGMSPFFGHGAAKSAAYRAYSSQKELLIDIYIPILASLSAQKYILQVIQWVGASILLPFAFILRIIPFTREFGNVLIALFFALYIIVPTLYAMSAKAFDQITDDQIACVGCNVYDFNTYALDGGRTGKDTVFYKIGSTIPQAVFIPNLVLVVAVTAAMSISKALRAFAV